MYLQTSKNGMKIEITCIINVWIGSSSGHHGSSCAVVPTSSFSVSTGEPHARNLQCTPAVLEAQVRWSRTLTLRQDTAVHRVTKPVLIKPKEWWDDFILKLGPVFAPQAGAVGRHHHDRVGPYSLIYSCTRCGIIIPFQGPKFTRNLTAYLEQTTIALSSSDALNCKLYWVFTSLTDVLARTPFKNDLKLKTSRMFVTPGGLDPKISRQTWNKQKHSLTC